MSAVIVDNTQALAQEASATLAEAQSFKITTPQQYEQSGERLKGIKALLQRIADTFDPHIKRAHDAHKALVAEKKQHESPLQTAEALIKRAILGYQQEEERKRRELEAKAQEEARKQREKLEAQAAKAAEKGKAERAEALQAAAAAVTVPMIAPTTPKVSGISTRITYRAEVTDKMALIQAIAAGSVPLAAVDANLPYLNGQARLNKEGLNYPGVKVVQETGLAASARR